MGFSERVDGGDIVWCSEQVDREVDSCAVRRRKLALEVRESHSSAAGAAGGSEQATLNVFASKGGVRRAYAMMRAMRTALLHW
jgi:hypothetical protein